MPVPLPWLSWILFASGPIQLILFFQTPNNLSPDPKHAGNRLNPFYTDPAQKQSQAAASRYVRDQNMDLTEIAFLLGFSELSTFSRSFKRWTGKSPIQCRKAA